MGKYKVDFAAIESRVSFEEAIEYLGLAMRVQGKTLRTRCPACNTQNKRSLAYTPHEGWYCHAADTGGKNLIGFVAHVRGVSTFDAAQELNREFPDKGGAKPSPTAPQVESEEPTSPNPLERIAARLQHDHEAVQALGFDPETARRCMIGYDPSGFNRGRVAFPIFENGELIGFLGYLDGAFKVPDSVKPKKPELPPNVVALWPKKAS